jgi:hypothetical protein
VRAVIVNDKAMFLDGEGGIVIVPASNEEE